MSTRFEAKTTLLKLNGEKFFVHGTKERLLYNLEDLLVSVGGFMGLFVGLSLNDVMDVLIDVVHKMGIRIKLA